MGSFEANVIEHIEPSSIALVQPCPRLLSNQRLNFRKSVATLGSCTPTKHQINIDPSGNTAFLLEGLGHSRHLEM